MLTTTAYFDKTIRDYVRPRALPIGIHLSLTLGKAVAVRRDVPDLVDELGNLKRGADRLIVARSKMSWVSPCCRRSAGNLLLSLASRAITVCNRRTPILSSTST
jgi:hypothetical protein